MPRRIALALLFFAATAVLFAEPDLPESDGDDSFEVEPPVLIPNRQSDSTNPGQPDASILAAQVERVQQALDRAVKNAKDAEHLYKMGAFSKAEVEQRALRVVRLQADLENARLAATKEELAAQEKRAAAGEISKSDLSESEAALVRAIRAAQGATAKKEKAELEAAETGLRRQRKLAAQGSARKGEVARAEKRLAKLKAAKD